MRLESQKVSEKKYEQKREKRFRNWATIVYPDSAASGWVDKLRDMHLQVLISPLHDKDIEDDSEPDETKKAHWHVVVCFPNPVTFDQMDEIRALIGGVRPQNIKSLEGTARYLIHKDHPHKFQYSASDVVAMGGIDYYGLISTGADEHEQSKEMRKFIRENYITSMAEFWDYCDEYRDDWSRLLESKMYGIERYIKSYSWAISRAEDKRG